MYNILDPCSKIFFGTDCCIGAICRGCYNLAIFFARTSPAQKNCPGMCVRFRQQQYIPVRLMVQCLAVYLLRAVCQRQQKRQIPEYQMF